MIYFNHNEYNILFVGHIILNILNIYLWKLICTVYSIDVVIRNTEESYRSLSEILQNNSNYKEGVNIYFPDPYYSFGLYKLYSISIKVDNPISLISTSENKTIFDYGETQQSSIFFYFYKEITIPVKISGIIFHSYFAEKTNPVFISSENEAFHINFENCEFSNNVGSVVSISYPIFTCTNNDNYQVEFNNYNKSARYSVLVLKPELKNFYKDNLEKCVSLKVSNSYFYRNMSIFHLLRGNLLIDNCIFENNDSSDAMNFSILFSENPNNRILIKNSIFKNNILNKNIPLFYLSKPYIKMENVTFSNNHSICGYLIYGEYINSEYSQEFVIKDSFFSENDNIISGKNNDIYIDKSEFKDTILRSSLPIVSNCINSNIKIENSNFNNLK
ncbi:hypothetical protein PIROE2DRAFT_9773 [Piromyces sp. E2]|nr:hypothetical protein PIROE2DRAFT_9773 [Piromyces sp. E2]|eukprot:OUM63627.1 hypothetical protein PIROE2DRAFT_9773 [Piromyces sp. E2]